MGQRGGIWEVVLPALGREEVCVRVGTVPTTNQGTGRERPPTGGPRGPSGRENDVLGLIARGLTNKENASRLSIAPSTAHQPTHHLLLKLGASNRPQLAVIALKCGLAGEADSRHAHSQGGVKGPASGAGQATAGPGPIRNGGSRQGPLGSRGEWAPRRRAEPPHRAAERRERTLPGR